MRQIKVILGGSYRIAAITDAPGEIELTNSVHPYWSSIRPADDPYWKRVNGLHDGTTKVQAQTLDSIIASEKLSGPFLIKLDVQGAEENALRGASETLKQTDLVIVEADADDFNLIHAALTAADFSLYDVTGQCWISDGSLGWFYPVYLNNRRADLKTASYWNAEQDKATIEMQVARRKAMLSENAFKLSKFQQMFPKKQP